jgi:transcriptional regulator GlxA family with amidase domain
VTNIRVRKAIRHLSETPDRSSPLGVLADSVRLSPRHFNRLFKNEVGMSPKQYVIRQRMRVAAELLETTSLDVQQIVERVGLHDYHHFLDCFKKTHGMTPTEYRDRHLQESSDKRLRELLEKKD